MAGKEGFEKVFAFALQVPSASKNSKVEKSHTHSKCKTNDARRVTNSIFIFSRPFGGRVCVLNLSPPLHS